MNQEFWDTVLAFCHATTTTVGEKLLQEFGQVQAIEKADGSLVTRADQWADGALREAIAQAFPNHGVLSEETTHVFPDTDWCWIVDPIDGTTNFTRGVPLWGISLGLLYQGTPVFGYVAVPPVQMQFYGYWYGTSGLSGPTGAFRNGEAIAPSTARPSSNHLFNLCARSISVLKQDGFPCKIRMLGIATYNLLTVASGIALGGVEATPKIWDIAAVWAIAQAAGATWHSLNPDPIFPLIPGKNYGQVAYPTLLLSQASLLPTFLPLVQHLSR
ncbi:MAG: inositol monophosphatase family protein [Cyanobacteria bacterium J06638_22]